MAPDAATAHLRRADPVLGRLIASLPEFDPRAWLAALPRFDAFGALVFQVAGQQLSVVATRRILDKLQERFGGRLPTPAELLAADPALVRSAGLSTRKVATLRAIAGRFADGSLSDERLQAMSDDEIEHALTAIPGVGPWTVHGFLIVALNRPDVVMPGDLVLRKAVRSAYGLDHVPSQDEVLRIAEPWRPYRSLATAYLFRSASEGLPTATPTAMPDGG
jgi:DNA-3-methyladenine glycosylase II